MSLSWTFLTKSFIGTKYRDVIAGIVVTKWVAGKLINNKARQNDNDNIMTRVYTNDESDIAFRDPMNKADHIVKREKLHAF